MAEVSQGYGSLSVWLTTLTQCLGCLWVGVGSLLGDEVSCLCRRLYLGSPAGGVHGPGAGGGGEETRLYLKGNVGLMRAPQGQEASNEKKCQ